MKKNIEKTKENKRAALWVSKENKEIVEEYARTNVLGLGEAADKIINMWSANRWQAEEERKAYLNKAFLNLNTAFPKSDAHGTSEMDKSLLEKPWWKFWS